MMNKYGFTLLILTCLLSLMAATPCRCDDTDKLQWRPLATRTFAGDVALGLEFSFPGITMENDMLTVSALARGAEIAELSWISDSETGLFEPLFSFDTRFSRFRYPFPDMGGRLDRDRIIRLESSFSAGTFLPGGFLLIATAGLDRFYHDEPFYFEAGTEGLPPAPDGTFDFLAFEIELDRLNSSFYPTRGYRLRAARKEWGVFSEEQEMKTRLHALSGSFFLDLPGAILSAHAASVTSRGPCPLYLRSHLGGERTIRGRDFGILSGDNSFLVRNELSIPLNFNDISELGNPVILVDLSLFADTGAVWNDGGHLSDQEFFSGFGLCLDFIPHHGWLLKIGSMWNSASNGSFYFDIGTAY